MPIALVSPMRLATPADGPALADLVNFAGEGLPLYTWQKLAQPGEEPWAIGVRSQAQRAEAGQIIAVDEGAGVIAAMTGAPIKHAQAITDAPLAMLRPLQELENEVGDTWHLNVLAAYPRARGRGWGARLVKHAEAMAREDGHKAVSIIVADENHGARRLYERLGYTELGRREIIKEEWETPSTQWILLKKVTA